MDGRRPAGVGVCKKLPHKVLSNGNTAFEMTIVRSAVPNLGKKFRLGVGLQYDWNDIAYLPAGSAVDKNGTLEHGPVQNLLVGEKKTVGAADIAIDGDFADWEALPASDVTVAATPCRCLLPGRQGAESGQQHRLPLSLRRVRRFG